MLGLQDSDIIPSQFKGNTHTQARAHMHTELRGMGVFACIINLCTTCVPSALEGQKRALDPVKLELQRVVRHHMGSRM